MKQSIEWKIDVAQVLAVILAILLLLFGYNQFSLISKVGDLELTIKELKQDIQVRECPKVETTCRCEGFISPMG